MLLTHDHKSFVDVLERSWQSSCFLPDFRAYAINFRPFTFIFSAFFRSSPLIVPIIDFYAKLTQPSKCCCCRSSCGNVYTLNNVACHMWVYSGIIGGCKICVVCRAHGTRYSSAFTIDWLMFMWCFMAYFFSSSLYPSLSSRSHATVNDDEWCWLIFLSLSLTPKSLFRQL